MPSTPLFSPQKFFSQREFSLGTATGVLLLGSIIAVASAAPYASQVLPGGSSIGLLVLSIVLGGAIGAMGILVIATLIIYLLASTVGGTGSLTDTAAAVGWASLPLLLLNTVGTAITWTLSFLGQLPPLTAADPLALPTWLLVFNAIVGILTYIWIGYLLTYAISTVWSLPVRRSALVAGTVVLLPVLNSLTMLL